MAKAMTTTTPATTAVVPVNPKLLQAVERIDSVLTVQRQQIAEASGMSKALLIANMMQTLRTMIDGPIIELVMELKNSPNGFLTDENSRKQGPYTPDVIKEALVTALVTGMYPVNNEFNILAGRFYGALNGWKRLFEQIPGISDINVVPGMPIQEGEIARCRVGISWKLHGVFNQLLDPKGEPGPYFVVHQRGGMGFSPDQVIGKAKRKAYKMAYEKATGSVTSEPDDNVRIEAAGQAQPRLPEPAGGAGGSVNRLAGRLGVETPAPAEIPHMDDLEAEDARRREEEQ